MGHIVLKLILLPLLLAVLLLQWTLTFAIRISAWVFDGCRADCPDLRGLGTAGALPLG